MRPDPITTLASIRTELEAGWKLFDDVYGGFGPADWARRFGRTWTYAEQPYHMAYFDAMIAKSLSDGGDGPTGERLHLKSMGDLNEWNRREFAKRDGGHTVADSLEEMKRSRDAIRGWLRAAHEPDLDGRVWMPLIFGWVTARDVLQACIVHNVAEYWKLWIRTGKRGPAPSPAAVHLRLAFMMSFMPKSLNRAMARTTPFTMIWNFEGAGGGAWTLAVRDGSCTVSESAATNPDLVITMKPEDFHRIVAKMTAPPLLMLTGKMKVKGLTKMGTFGKLFPEPKADQIIDV